MSESSSTPLIERPEAVAGAGITPRATYRFQFNEQFRLTHALALVPYLCELGISHVYASPLFKAVAHSVHGYDVCDFGRLNPEIGTEAELEQLVTALRQRQMGLVLDIVPNHMGIATPDNRWWQDVLKNGRASQFADHFDIQWEPADPKLRDKILLPILGDHYEEVLKRGELKLQRENGEAVLCYFDHRFPLAPDSVPGELSGGGGTAHNGSLSNLVQKQNYVLAYWGDGDLKLNYRRFFAISTLAGVRAEDENVFHHTHALLKRWIEKNWLDGLRVDHPDGLREPKKYTEWLRVLAPKQWIIIEKILQPGESVPQNWPVEGTVGYDFLNELNGLFIDSQNEKAFTVFFSDFTGEPADAGKMVREKKRLVLETLFVTEVNRLLDLLALIAARFPAQQKCSREDLRAALIEYAACFPIYRTYVRPKEETVDENDFNYIKEATAVAKKSRADLGKVFDFLNDLLLLLHPGEPEGEFVARFQQLTGPVMAKGVEDTTFYCLNRFLSLNEVGGDPGKFGVSDDEFHDFCGKLAAHSPHTMLSSSTHDTKRSEDVRARLNVLSEIPEEWSAAVLRWSKMNEEHRKNHFPDRNIEYVLYQTLVGAWPISLERLVAYMEKVACEAKEHTNWNHRNAQYDEALKNFVTAVFGDRNFIRDLEKFIASLAEAAQINSLAQTLVKLTAPGVPDIYQGNEIWDFSLVDPDNRRTVDFKLRTRLLSEARKMSAEESWRRRDEGLPKLWLIQRTLAFRSRHGKFFQEGYEPLFLSGKNADRVVAFIRGGRVITIVPRFTRSRTGELPMLALPEGKWRNEFTGEIFTGEVAVGKLFDKFPVALLVRE